MGWNVYIPFQPIVHINQSLQFSSVNNPSLAEYVQIFPYPTV